MNPNINSSFMSKVKFCRYEYDKLKSETFIAEVKKHECLWNASSKEYSMHSYVNQELKRYAWEDISRMLNGKWDTFSSEERLIRVLAAVGLVVPAATIATASFHILVDYMSRKWAHIRKYYTNESRRYYEGPAKKRTRRKYHELLSFLDDSINTKRNTRIKKSKEILRNVDIDRTNDNSSDSEPRELCIIEDADELAKLSQIYDEPVNVVKIKDKPNLDDKTDFKICKAPLGLSTRSAKNKIVISQSVTQTSDITRLLNKAEELVKLSQRYDKDINAVKINDKPNTDDKPIDNFKTCKAPLCLATRSAKNKNLIFQSVAYSPEITTLLNKAEEVVKLSQRYDEAININIKDEPVHDYKTCKAPLGLARRNAKNINALTQTVAQNSEITRLLNKAEELAKQSQRYDEAVNTVKIKDEPNSDDEPVNDFKSYKTPLDIATRSSKNKNVFSQTIAQNPEITRLLNKKPRFPTISPLATNTFNNVVSLSIQDTLATPSMFDVNSDACEKFLLSLLPEFRLLNPKQNMQFRHGIVDLLNNIKLRTNK